MELIERAIAKARADAQQRPRPTEEIAPPAPWSQAADLFDPAAPVLTLSPKVLEANRIVSWDKWNPATPAFDILRTKVLGAMKARGWRTLGIASPSEDSGKTTVAINLAMSIAHQVSSEVVLVDFDLRHPQLAGYLGIAEGGDFAAFLSGQGSLKTYIVAAGEAQLRVVPTKESRHNATELLCQPQVERLLNELRTGGTARIGIFDLPPLLVTDDALAVLPRLDCALMVLGERRTRKPEVIEALNLLEGVNLLGVVLNGSREKVKSYY